jgi:hypothetical protein
MTWTKALTLLLAVSVLAAPIAFPQIAAANGNELMQDYASREAQAGDLADFSGGWHGVVIGVLVVLAVLWLFTSVFDDDDDDGDVNIIERGHAHP